MQERLEEALLHAPLSFALIDSSEVYLFVSEAYAQRFDAEPDQMIGRKMGNFFDSPIYDSHIKPKLQECLSGQTVGFQIEGPLNGVDRLLTIRYLPCFDESGKVWAVLNIAIDITSDCRPLSLVDNSTRYWDKNSIGDDATTYFDNTLIQSRVDRSERLSSLGRSVAMLSHEMRNPLGSLSASLMFLKHLLPDTPEATRALERCNRSMQRCEKLVSGLLDYSKPFEIKLQQLDLDRMIEQLLEDYCLPASITVAWQSGAVGEVWLDDEMMSRALINLMDNSVRALSGLPSGSERLLSLETQTSEYGVDLIIRDTGPGIPVALHGDCGLDIVDSSTNGTGFGLLIARQIVERHRGLLLLGDSPHGGAEVCIRLPAL